MKDLSRSAFFYTIYKMLLFIQGKTFPILLINYLCPFGYNFQESNIMYKSIIIGFSIGLLIAIKAASKCQKEPFNLHVSKIFYIVAFVNFILLLFYAFIFTRFRVNSWILMTVSIFYYVSVIIQGPLITHMKMMEHLIDTPRTLDLMLGNIVHAVMMTALTLWSPLVTEDYKEKYPLSYRYIDGTTFQYKNASMESCGQGFEDEQVLRDYNLGIQIITMLVFTMLVLFFTCLDEESYDHDKINEIVADYYKDEYADIKNQQDYIMNYLSLKAVFYNHGYELIDEGHKYDIRKITETSESVDIQIGTDSNLPEGYQTTCLRGTTYQEKFTESTISQGNYSHVRQMPTGNVYQIHKTNSQPHLAGFQNYKNDVNEMEVKEYTIQNCRS